MHVSLLVPTALLLISTHCSGANLLTTNPGAESGTLEGWTPVWMATGGDRAPVPEATVIINTDPTASSQGNNSFRLSDQSTQTSVGIHTTERIEISSDVDYVFSFDARVESGDIEPWVQIDSWTEASGGTIFMRQGPALNVPGSFSRIVPALNGFLHYEVILTRPWGSGSMPPPSALYYDVTFYTEFYGSSRGSVLIDNVAFSVPEPSSWTLLCGVGIAAAARRRRPVAEA